MWMRTEAPLQKTDVLQFTFSDLFNIFTCHFYNTNPFPSLLPNLIIVSYKHRHFLPEKQERGIYYTFNQKKYTFKIFHYHFPVLLQEYELLSYKPICVYTTATYGIPQIQTFLMF